LLQKIQKDLEKMKRILTVFLSISFLAGACAPEKGIEVHSAWMRPAPQGENGAAYFVIHNHSSKAEELTGLSSDAAEAVEIHVSKMNGDVMEMQQLVSL
jgi:copper(I)-binding protein